MEKIDHMNHSRATDEDEAEQTERGASGGQVLEMWIVHSWKGGEEDSLGSDGTRPWREGKRGDRGGGGIRGGVGERKDDLMRYWN